MQTFVTTGSAAVDAKSMWQVLSDFRHGNFLGERFGAKNYECDSSDVGAVRFIPLPKRRTVYERLVQKNVAKMTLAYEFDFEKGNAFDGLLDYYLAQISVKPTGAASSEVSFTVTYNWVGDAGGEQGWKASMGASYTSWIGNAAEKAAAIPVTYAVDEGGEGGVTVGVITLDDGKANAFSFDFCAALDSALDAAEADDAVKAVVIRGNAKAFSAGFDLSVMADPSASAEDRAALLHAGGMVVVRVYAFPKPVVLAVTGHALALGAIMLFAGDVRIGQGSGAAKPAKIGMNEVAIGMTLPDFAVQLARQRILPTKLTQCLTQAAVFSAAGAAEVGYLDGVAGAGEHTVEAVTAAALEEARRLGGYVRQPAFARMKLIERGPVIEGLYADMRATKRQAILAMAAL